MSPFRGREAGSSTTKELILGARPLLAAWGCRVSSMARPAGAEEAGWSADSARAEASAEPLGLGGDAPRNQNPHGQDGASSHPPGPPGRAEHTRPLASCVDSSRVRTSRTSGRGC